MTIPLAPNVIARRDRTTDPWSCGVAFRRRSTRRRSIRCSCWTAASPRSELQAAGAIRDHAQAVASPRRRICSAIAEFQLTDAFFSSPALRGFALAEVPAPALPQGRPRRKSAAAASSRTFRRIRRWLQAGPLFALPQRATAEPDQPVRVGIHWTSRFRPASVS